MRVFSIHSQLFSILEIRPVPISLRMKRKDYDVA